MMRAKIESSSGIYQTTASLPTNTNAADKIPSPIIRKDDAIHVLSSLFTSRFISQMNEDTLDFGLRHDETIYFGEQVTLVPISTHNGDYEITGTLYDVSFIWNWTAAENDLSICTCKSARLQVAKACLHLRESLPQSDDEISINVINFQNDYVGKQMEQNQENLKQQLVYRHVAPVCEIDLTKMIITSADDVHIPAHFVLDFFSRFLWDSPLWRNPDSISPKITCDTYWIKMSGITQDVIGMEYQSHVTQYRAMEFAFSLWGGTLSGRSTRVRYIGGRSDGIFRMQFESISCLTFDGFDIVATSPFHNTKIYHQNSDWHVHLTEIELKRGYRGQHGHVQQPYAMEGHEFHFPFRVGIIAQRIELHDDILGHSFEAHSLQMNLNPASEPIFCAGTNISIPCMKYFYWNSWLKLNNIALKCILSKDCSTLHAFSLSAPTGSFEINKSSIEFIENDLKSQQTLDSNVNSGFLTILFPTIEPINLTLHHHHSNDHIAGVLPIIPPSTTLTINIPPDDDKTGITSTTNIGTILRHYSSIILTNARVDAKRVKEFKTDVHDSIAATVGRAALVGTACVGPVGIAASCAAVTVSDGISHAVSVGKSARGVSKDEAYQLGDLTRGVVSSSARLIAGRETDGGGDNDDVGKGWDGVVGGTKEYVSENRGRFGRVGGASVGAMLGMGILGGPVGFVAGSLVGGKAGKTAFGKKDEENAEKKMAGEAVGSRRVVGDDFLVTESSSISDVNRTASNKNNSVLNKSTCYTPERLATKDNVEPINVKTNSCGPEPTPEPKQGYRFGDITRSIIARGKIADHRDKNDVYKFGDFTRGLFK